MTSSILPAEAGCDGLTPCQVTRDLETRIMGSRVIVLERTTSTNDIAWREALAGAPEGTVIFAEEQTDGRGRMGRAWHSPPAKGLLMSVLFRPHLNAQQGNLITVMSAIAVSQALGDSLDLQVRIRWPNDIVIKDRKVAGILVEGRSLPRGAAFVLGVGLNVNMRPDEFPPELSETATSLAAELGKAVSRVSVARWMLLALERWYRVLRLGEHGRIAQQWRRLSSTLGRRVMLLEDGREFMGRVLDLSLEDGLIVRLDEGLTRVFRPATVTLRQPEQ